MQKKNSHQGCKQTKNVSWPELLKLINNSSSENEGNHSREGGLDTRS